MPKKKPRPKNEKPQHERFKELAKRVGVDKNDGAFIDAFKKAVPPKRRKKAAS